MPLMLSVTIKPFVLSVTVLNVVKLAAVRLSVVAPNKTVSEYFQSLKGRKYRKTKSLSQNYLTISYFYSVFRPFKSDSEN